MRAQFTPRSALIIHGGVWTCFDGPSAFFATSSHHIHRFYAYLHILGVFCILDGIHRTAEGTSIGRRILGTTCFASGSNIGIVVIEEGTIVGVIHATIRGVALVGKLRKLVNGAIKLKGHCHRWTTGRGRLIWIPALGANSAAAAAALRRCWGRSRGGDDDDAIATVLHAYGWDSMLLGYVLQRRKERRKVNSPHAMPWRRSEILCQLHWGSFETKSTVIRFSGLSD